MSACMIQARLAFHQAVTCAEHSGFVLRQLARVHLEAHMALGRDPGAQMHVEHAARRVAAARAHMAAGDAGRQEECGLVLDAQAFQRVVAVGEPDAVGARQDAEIDPAAARGAALDLDSGEVPAKAVEQIEGAAGLGRIRAGQHPVVVPFEVIDGVVAQQGADLRVEEIADLRIRHVERELVAPQRLVGRAEHPVGMGAAGVGVRR